MYGSPPPKKNEKKRKEKKGEGDRGNLLKIKLCTAQVGAVVKGKFTKILLSKSLRTVNESLCLSLLTKEDTIDIEFTNENIRLLC